MSQDIKLVIDQLNQICEPLLTSDYDNINNAVDMLERLGNKVAQQAAVIEKQLDVLRRIATSRTGADTDLVQELFVREDWASEALAIPTDSKQALADWMREQLGDSIATLKFGGGKPHFSATVVSVNNPPLGTHQLFKLPECLK